MRLDWRLIHNDHSSCDLVSELSKELEELHATVIRSVRQRMEESADAEDIRLALQLLKQNSITASIAETDAQAMKSKMAGKLNFSALKDKKVTPIRPPVDASPHHERDQQETA